MHKHLRAFLILTFLAWQSLAAFGASPLSQALLDWDHQLAHCQDASHHHHADSALHLDGEEGALQHLHADPVGGTLALLGAQAAPLAEAAPMALPAARHAAWLSPTLAGPLRPPMRRA